MQCTGSAARRPFRSGVGLAHSYQLDGCGELGSRDQGPVSDGGRRRDVLLHVLQGCRAEVEAGITLPCGDPYVFPTEDAAVFTHGLLPPDEKTLNFFILGAEAALAQVGIGAEELVDLGEPALRDALDKRVITSKRELDASLAKHLRDRLLPEQRHVWDAPSPFAEGQLLGEALSSFALRPLALRGVVCFGQRRGNQATFVRTDQWLPRTPPPHGEREARAELTRRYLHCYGPSTAKDFAGWAGIHQDQAETAWQSVRGDLTGVRYGGKPAWILRTDTSALQSPSSPRGVRLLPPLDPWVLLRDRETILPDTANHRRVWRRQGWPGTVLVKGVLVGLWHPAKKGKVLELRVEPFTNIAGKTREEIECEAQGLATMRGCESAKVSID